MEYATHREVKNGYKIYLEKLLEENTWRIET